MNVLVPPLTTWMMLETRLATIGTVEKSVHAFVMNQVHGRVRTNVGTAFDARLDVMIRLPSCGWCHQDASHHCHVLSSRLLSKYAVGRDQVHWLGVRGLNRHRFANAHSSVVVTFKPTKCR